MRLNKSYFVAISNLISLLSFQRCLLRLSLVHLFIICKQAPLTFFFLANLASQGVLDKIVLVSTILGLKPAIRRQFILLMDIKQLVHCFLIRVIFVESLLRTPNALFASIYTNWERFQNTLCPLLFGWAGQEFISPISRGRLHELKHAYRLLLRSPNVELSPINCLVEERWLRAYHWRKARLGCLWGRRWYCS